MLKWMAAARAPPWEPANNQFFRPTTGLPSSRSLGKRSIIPSRPCRHPPVDSLAWRPADEVLSSEQLTVLATERQRGRTLPPNPTVAESTLAVARLGGFITSNKVAGYTSVSIVIDERALEDTNEDGTLDTVICV